MLLHYLSVWLIIYLIINRYKTLMPICYKCSNQSVITWIIFRLLMWHRYWF